MCFHERKTHYIWFQLHLDVVLVMIVVITHVGHEENRLLTHFYSLLYFATAKEEHRAKRFIRDRLRYHDQIFCTASIFLEKLLLLEEYLSETRDEKKVNSEEYKVCVCLCENV